MTYKQVLYNLSFILCLSVFIACSEDKDNSVAEPSEDILLIGAGASERLATRTVYETDDDSNVTEGDFWLTYPTTASSAKGHVFQRVSVDFSKAQWYDKYQRYYTYTEAKEGGEELTWSIVGTIPNLIYMDNVDPALNTSENDTIVVFPSPNPYSAGLMTNDKDILWGSLQQQRTSNLLNFDLHHVMAGVRVKITVDTSTELVDQYDLSQAEVYLSNIVLNPYSYTRTTGDIALPTNPAYEELVMVDNFETEGEPAQEIIDWNSITTQNPDNQDDPGYPVYITQDFILPPQTPSEDYWPELVVRFPNPSPEEAAEGKTYKEFYGKIPKAMFTDYTTGTNYSLAISFLREHVLEIRTMISQNPPQLVFMPVRVYNWVNWGPYTIVGHQEGIYNTTQLSAIIVYYQAYNSKMLERYGELIDNQWRFNIFSNLRVRLSEISEAMKQTDQKYPASFSLNGHKVYVLDDDTGKVLYVITSNSDFNNLIVNGIEPTPGTPEPEEP